MSTTSWTCPHCGAMNHEAPETVMAECESCGRAHDMLPLRSYTDMTPQERADYDARHGITPARRAEVAERLKRI